MLEEEEMFGEGLLEEGLMFGEDLLQEEEMLGEDMLQSTGNASLEDSSRYDDTLFLGADTYDHILEVDALNSAMSIDGAVDAEEEGEGRRRMSSSRKFYLKNKRTGKYLDVAGAQCHNGNNIHLWEFNGSKAQEFYWHTAPNGKTYLINAGCHKAVDINRGDCGNEVNIFLWQYHGGSNQEFKRYHEIIYNPKCRTAIDNSYGRTNNGNNIISFQINFSSPQQWEMVYF